MDTVISNQLAKLQNAQAMNIVTTLGKNMDASVVSLLVDAADPAAVYDSIQKVKQLKALTFKVTNANGAGATQDFKIFDVRGFNATTNGADTTTTVISQLPGSASAKYSAVIASVAYHAVVCTGFKLQVSNTDQFSENFQLRQTDWNGDVVTADLQTLISLSENPNYQQDNILYVPYRFIMDDYFCIVGTILAASNFTFTPVFAGIDRMS